MKILFIASRFPYPLTQGDRLRAYHFLRLLSKHYQVTLVVPIQTTEEYEVLPILESFCYRIEAIQIKTTSRIANLFKAPFSSLLWQVTYYWNQRIQQKVNELLTQSTFDMVHTQLARMAPFAQQWEKTLKVLDFTDALSLNMARRAKQESWMISWLFNAEAKRMQHYERSLTKTFDRLVIFSAVDQKAIGDFSNLDVIPNGVDLADFPFVEAQHYPNTIIFAGNMR